MIRMNLQLFGGRGGGSRMTSGGNVVKQPTDQLYGANSARGEFDAAERDRARIAAISPSQRTPEQHQQLEDAINRKSDASYRMISEMSDDEIQKAADDYIKNEIDHPTDTDAGMRKWIKRISATKKDGSPTKSALDNAMDESIDVINSRRGMNLDVKAYSTKDHPTEIDRISRAIVKAASKYKDRF